MKLLLAGKGATVDVHHHTLTRKGRRKLYKDLIDTLQLMNIEHTTKNNTCIRVTPLKEIEDRKLAMIKAMYMINSQSRSVTRMSQYYTAGMNAIQAARAVSMVIDDPI